jgi:regulator of nucleoside diphosphate kinase
MRTLQNILITQADKTRLQAVIDRARQEESESRPGLDDLQRELDRAEVIDPELIPEGLVTMNATVRLRDLDSNETETYTLVFPQDSDIRCNRISVLAPVGTAIIGCQVGDVVTWSVPRGKVQLRIEDVIPQGPLHHDQAAGAVLVPT